MAGEVKAGLGALIGNAGEYGHVRTAQASLGILDELDVGPARVIPGAPLGLSFHSSSHVIRR